MASYVPRAPRVPRKRLNWCAANPGFGLRGGGGHLVDETLARGGVGQGRGLRPRLPPVGLHALHPVVGATPAPRSRAAPGTARPWAPAPRARARLSGTLRGGQCGPGKRGGAEGRADARGAAGGAGVEFPNGPRGNLGSPGGSRPQQYLAQCFSGMNYPTPR